MRVVAVETTGHQGVLTRLDNGVYIALARCSLIRLLDRRLFIFDDGDLGLRVEGEAAEAFATVAAPNSVCIRGAGNDRTSCDGDVAAVAVVAATDAGTSVGA